MKPSAIIWIAGTGWDGVPGTDKRLVQALPADQKVVWIDPPVRLTFRYFWSRLRGQAPEFPEKIAQNIWRVRVRTFPGITRAGIRLVTALLLSRSIRRAIKASGMTASAVVIAFPLARFPRRLRGRKVLYVTDDWIEGSELMGFSRGAVQRALVSNIKRADNIAVISPPLIRMLRYLPISTTRIYRSTNASVHVVPNGCPDPSSDPMRKPEPVAGLVGQLNERLDLDALEALQATGTSIRVIGPRADRNPHFRARLDRFLAADNVTWLGCLSAADTAREISKFGVGLTPYADTAFNRASFPLKTLEYLSAGVAVVSTDMPAARWLNTDHVSMARNADDFARATLRALSEPRDSNQATLRRQFAASHSWHTRALQFLQLLDPDY